MREINCCVIRLTLNYNFFKEERVENLVIFCLYFMILWLICGIKIFILLLREESFFLVFGF